MINSVAWSLNWYWWDWVEAVPFIENIEVSVSQGVICTGKLWDHADLSEYMYTHVIVKSTINSGGGGSTVHRFRKVRERKQGNIGQHSFTLGCV